MPSFKILRFSVSLGRVVREVEMLRKWFRRAFLHFFNNITKILIAFWFIEQSLHHERVSFEGFLLVVGFSCTSEKKFDCGFFPFERYQC